MRGQALGKAHFPKLTLGNLRESTLTVTPSMPTPVLVPIDTKRCFQLYGLLGASQPSSVLHSHGITAQPPSKAVFRLSPCCSQGPVLSQPQLGQNMGYSFSPDPTWVLGT